MQALDGGRMFDVLTSSRTLAAPRSLPAAIASACVHVAFALAIVTGGRAAPHAATSFEMEIAHFLFPRDHAPTEARETIHYVAVRGNGDGTESGSDASHGADPRSLRRTSSRGSSAPVPNAEQDASRVAEELGAFSLLDVDTAAVRDPDSAAPSYPTELAQRGVEGFASMRFVVDSTGLIDLATVVTLDASNELFVRAVRDAMPGMHFRPARMGTVAVRQLAEQEFRFELHRAETASTDQATGPRKAKPER
jgi:hypothetical protein